MGAGEGPGGGQRASAGMHGAAPPAELPPCRQHAAMRCVCAALPLPAPREPLRTPPRPTFRGMQLVQ